MDDQPEDPELNAGENIEANNNQNGNRDHIPEDAAEGHNMAQAEAVQGGQLSSITLFTGTKGLEALTYAEAIDGSLAQFGWTQAQAAQAAISRGGNAMANWIRGEWAAGITYNSWTKVANGQRPLRPAFISRFGPVYTTSGAVSAIADLKQRNTENAAAFMDRVKIAVDMLNYNVPEADRNAAFRQGYVRMVVAECGGGLHEDLRAKVFGVPNPPATIEGALTAASAAEAEKTNHKLVVSMIDEATKEETSPWISMSIFLLEITPLLLPSMTSSLLPFGWPLILSYSRSILTAFILPWEIQGRQTTKSWRVRI